MENFATAFGMIFQLPNIVLMVVGLIIGIIIGAIPGLNTPLAVALALPFTFHLPPLAGLSMLIGIYKGGTYGGSISAILINVPGTPAAACTAIDGSVLAKKGQAGKALKMSIYASIFGELCSDLVLILLAFQIARIALEFGPAEYFALGLFALTVIGMVSGKSLLRGLISGFLGILLSTSGFDPIDGGNRFSFGIYELSGGLTLIPMIIGVFAIAEVLVQAEKCAFNSSDRNVLELSPNPEDNRVTRDDLKEAFPAILRGTLIGTIIGAIPGTGAAIAAFLSYGLAKRFSKTPEKFGEGALEGVAAAESANNGVCGTTLVPLLTLGIPGDVVTAIMVGALMVHGLIPGPTLFQQHGDFVTALFIGMLIATILHLFIAMLGLPLFIRAVRTPRGVLFPLVAILCVTGTLAATGSTFDLFVMLGFGFLGYAMIKFGYPVPPMLIGFILGPLVEVALRQSMTLSNDSISIFFTRPVACFFVVLTGIVIVSMAWGAWKRKLKGTT